MITNALLVKYQGGYVEVTDDTSIGADGRFEGYLTVQVSSEADAIAAGTAMLAVTTTAQPAVSLGIEPSTGDEPYVDFGVGDTVTVPTPSGGTLTERVVSLTVTEDDEGDPTFVPEVNRLTVPVDQRVAAKVAGITAGSVGDPTPAGLASKQGGGALPSSFALPVSFGGLASPANSPSVWSQGETGAGSGGRVIVPVVSPPSGTASPLVHTELPQGPWLYPHAEDEDDPYTWFLDSNPYAYISHVTVWHNAEMCHIRAQLDFGITVTTLSLHHGQETPAVYYGGECWLKFTEASALAAANEAVPGLGDKLAACTFGPTNLAGFQYPIMGPPVGFAYQLNDYPAEDATAARVLLVHPDVSFPGMLGLHLQPLSPADGSYDVGIPVNPWPVQPLVSEDLFVDQMYVDIIGYVT
jgi:hypothetical protein